VAAGRADPDILRGGLVEIAAVKGLGHYAELRAPAAAERSPIRVAAPSPRLAAHPVGKGRLANPTDEEPP
jgi:hypothetical protein